VAATYTCRELGTTVMKNYYKKSIVAYLQKETRETDYKLMYLMNSKFTVQ